jgi:hypothetical protein
VEITLAHERDRLPASSPVIGADEAQEGWEAVAAVGVSRPQEPVGADDREAHRVLEAVPDALGLVFAFGRAEQTRVGGD